MAYNTLVSFDFDYHKRLQWLADLMRHFPNKKVRKLQAEALHMYQINGTEGIRNWMKLRTAFLAADIIIREDENEARLHDSPEAIFARTPYASLAR